MPETEWQPRHGWSLPHVTQVAMGCLMSVMHHTHEWLARKFSQLAGVAGGGRGRSYMVRPPLVALKIPYQVVVSPAALQHHPIQCQLFAFAMHASNCFSRRGAVRCSCLTTADLVITE